MRKNEHDAAPRLLAKRQRLFECIEVLFADSTQALLKKAGTFAACHFSRISNGPEPVPIFQQALLVRRLKSVTVRRFVSGDPR